MAAHAKNPDRDRRDKRALARRFSPTMDIGGLRL